MRLGFKEGQSTVAGKQPWSKWSDTLSALCESPSLADTGFFLFLFPAQETPGKLQVLRMPCFNSLMMEGGDVCLSLEYPRSCQVGYIISA